MAHLLTPLAERIEAHVLEGGTIYTHDTVVAVQSPGLKRTKKGRLWAYVHDERPWGSVIPPAALTNRKGEHPQTHLKHYEGFLHIDDFFGYGKLFVTGKALEQAEVRRHL